MDANELLAALRVLADAASEDQPWVNTFNDLDNEIMNGNAPDEWDLRPTVS